MAYWLLKTEPDEYAWDDLVKEKRAVWDGISNALALQHLRTFQKGDQALIYHSGSQKAAVGIAEVVKGPYPDPAEQDSKRVVVDLKPAQKLGQPVTLATIRADKTFEGWDLLRISRLSVVPVPQGMWKRVIKLSEPEA